MNLHLLNSMLAGAAMLLGTTAATAAIPEHLYMVGEASPSLWHIDIAQEMTNEGEGVFSYRGTLYNQNLQFIDARNWDTGVRYVPEVSGSWLINAHEANIVSGIGNENRFWVTEPGTYEVKVYFGDNGESVMITAQWVGEMAPMVVPLGAISGQWDSASVPFPYNIYPKEGTDDVFVYECTVKPGADSKHLKFISYPSNYWETWFYLPESVDNGVVKFVKIGDKLKIRRAWNDGNLDHFWGFADEDCTPEKKVRVTLNLGDDTIEFSEPGAGVEGVEAGNTLKASFVGDNLVVENAGAAVAVYDIAGRKVAYSAAGMLTVPGLPCGVYVVKTAGAAVKVAK